MKLLVMGAGYTGMAFLNYLQNTPHEVYITTTREERVETLKPFGDEILILQADNDSRLREVILSCDGMVVMVAPKNSANYQETYLKTAERIAFILKEKTTPFYLLYTSSTSVCEGIENEWVFENRLLDPQSDNAKILLATENTYLNCGVTSCILRLGGIYGPGRELEKRAKRFSGVEMAGEGEEATNHIHVEDIVSAIAFCLNRSLTGVYHLVNDDHTSRKVLYAHLCHSMGILEPTWGKRLAKKKFGYKISNQKIKDAGFVFRYPLLKIPTTTGICE
ncbi:Protein yeeZ [Chlamydiales bacterium STE3]|nr:Protein yeeZ [Chlamydiales bacterium STE3]